MYSIDTAYLGKGAKAQTHYRIINDNTAAVIASFKTLEEAAIVSRYLQGFTLDEADEARARGAIKTIDEETAAHLAAKQAKADKAKAARAAKAAQQNN